MLAQNILISNKNSPNETSIIIDPKHPNIMVAAANINSYYYSSDTGHTWTEKSLYSESGVWGDPALAVDTSGHFYYFHLSNPSSGSKIDRIVCQKSLDKGMTWTNGTYTGLNGTKKQDKQWCAIDKKTNTIYITWTQFDNYGTANPNDSSIILFSKSTDTGHTWSTPIRINKVAGDCMDGDKTVEGAVPAVGPSGEVYVAWAGPNGIVFNRSLDQGKTWLNKEITVDAMPTGWDYAVPGIFRANGLPITTCDLSNGPNRGTIYINWSDQRNGATNTDVWLAKSADGGKTWSKARRVNDDTSKRHQFFTWMTIDQSSGYLYFVFYDRRNYTSDSTDVFVAISKNGGNTFFNRKISQSAFLPTQNVFFGDYTNITAHNGIIRPIWTRLNNGQLSVWTDITNLNDIIFTSVKSPLAADVMSFENYPNPSHDYTFVSFKLPAKSLVNLTFIDIQGKVVSNIINNETRGYGKYVERIDLDELNIPAGLYFLKLEINNEVKILKLVTI